MMVLGCSIKTSHVYPELILDYGWSEEVTCKVGEKETKCKLMTVEDAEKLRRWIIFMQEMCK